MQSSPSAQRGPHGGSVLQGTSQGRPNDLPPSEWIRDELVEFGCLDVPNVQAGNLDGEIHPIFEQARFEGMSKERYNSLEQSLRLASHLLDISMVYFTSFIPDVVERLVPTKANQGFGEEEEEGNIQSKYVEVRGLATDNGISQTDAILRQISKDVVWKEDPEIWVKRGWAGYTSSMFPRPSDAGPEDPSEIANADAILVDEGKQHRLITIFIAQEYIDTLISTPEDTEQHMTAAFHAALTMVHEIGHFVYWFSFDRWNEYWFEPTVNEDVYHELGFGLIAWLFRGWVPEALDLGNEDDRRSFKTGTMWKKQLRRPIGHFMTRPEWDIQYSMPFEHIQRLFFKNQWTGLDQSVIKGLYVTVNLLGPQGNFCNGKNARRATCKKELRNGRWIWSRKFPLQYDFDASLEGQYRFPGGTEDNTEILHGAPRAPGGPRSHLPAEVPRIREESDDEEDIFKKPPQGPNIGQGGFFNRSGEEGGVNIKQESVDPHEVLHPSLLDLEELERRGWVAHDVGTGPQQHIRLRELPPFGFMDEDWNAADGPPDEGHTDFDNLMKTIRQRYSHTQPNEALHYFQNLRIETEEGPFCNLESFIQDVRDVLQWDARQVVEQHRKAQQVMPRQMMPREVNKQSMKAQYSSASQTTGDNRGDVHIYPPREPGQAPVNDNTLFLGPEKALMWWTFGGDLDLKRIEEYGVPIEFLEDSTGSSRAQGQQLLNEATRFDHMSELYFRSPQQLAEICRQLKLSTTVSKNVMLILIREFYWRAELDSGIVPPWPQSTTQDVIFKTQRSIWKSKWDVMRLKATSKSFQRLEEDPPGKHYQFQVHINPEKTVGSVKGRLAKIYNIPVNDLIIHIEPPLGTIFLTRDKDDWTFEQVGIAVELDHLKTEFLKKEQGQQDVSGWGEPQGWGENGNGQKATPAIPANQTQRALLQLHEMGAVMFRYCREGAPYMKWFCRRQDPNLNYNTLYEEEYSHKMMQVMPWKSLEEGLPPAPAPGPPGSQGGGQPEISRSQSGPGPSAGSQQPQPPPPAQNNQVAPPATQDSNSPGPGSQGQAPNPPEVVQPAKPDSNPDSESNKGPPAPNGDEQPDKSSKTKKTPVRKNPNKVTKSGKKPAGATEKTPKTPKTPKPKTPSRPVPAGSEPGLRRSERRKRAPVRFGT